MGLGRVNRAPFRRCGIIFKARNRTPDEGSVDFVRGTHGLRNEDLRRGVAIV